MKILCAIATLMIAGVAYGQEHCANELCALAPPTIVIDGPRDEAKHIVEKITLQIEAYKGDSIGIDEAAEIAAVEQDLHDTDAATADDLDEAVERLERDWVSLLLKDAMLEHGYVI